MYSYIDAGVDALNDARVPRKIIVSGLARLPSTRGYELRTNENLAEAPPRAP